MKKLLSFILSLCLLTTIISAMFTVSAAIVEKGIITVGTTTANTGDEISIPIEISENPGIMAITVSITYDSKSLQYIEYLEGTVIKDYTVVDHPNKNLIRFVSCESANKKRNGNLITIRFKVKNNAEWDFSKIDIQYSQGDFCNWNLDKIMPTIVSGGVDIAYNGSNCSHKNYSEWKTIAEPTCDDQGIKERICQKCNHVDYQKIDKIGHEFPEEWTVETVATKDNPGTMVRYCITCNEFCDRIEYTIEDSEEGNFDNQIGTEIPKNETIEENFKEQHPNEEFTPVKPPLKDNSTSNSQSNTSSNNDPTIKDVFEDLFGENKDSETSENDNQISEDNTDNNSEITNSKSAIKLKIMEVFPKYETIVKYFKTALIILVILVLI